MNDGDEDVCTVLVAPSTSRYFEAYVFDADPIGPGAIVTLPVADVRQDVRTLSCNPQEILGEFDFDPSRAVQALAPLTVRSSALEPARRHERPRARRAGIARLRA